MTSIRSAVRNLRSQDGMTVKSLRAVVWLIVGFHLCEASATGEGAPLPPPVPETHQTGPVTASRPDHRVDTVTLNFDGADLVEVIHVLARHLRLNYTVDRDVRGVVTLFSGHAVRTDDLWPIFHEILRIHDAVAIRRGNMYRITSIAKGPGLARPGGVEGAGFAMHIFPVRFLPVAAMKRLLTPFMSDGGTILEHVRGNYLVLVDLVSNIRRLSEIKELIDVEVFAGTRMELYQPRAATAHDLAREMSAAMRLFGASAAQEDVFAARFLPLPRINQLLVIAYSEAAWNYVKRWIERIDVTAETQGRKIFIRPVENGKATELARVLSQIYGFAGSSEENTSPRRRWGGPGIVRDLSVSGSGQGSGRTPFPSAAGFDGSSDVRAAARKQPPGQALRRPSVPGDTPGAGVRVVAEPATNSLVILATPREFRDIEEVLGRLDLIPRQVLMEVLVAEVTLGDDFQFGVEYALSKGGFGPAVSQDDPSDNQPEGIGFRALESGFTSIIDAGREFRVFVNALMRDARVKVLSSPHLLAVDNRPARIRVGSEQPVATGMVVSQEAQATTTTIQFKNVGRILTIVPQVNSEGLVHLQVRVEVSDVGERVVVGRQSFDAFNVRDAETTAVLQDGQTLVIGGIITDNRRRTRIGIPLLMELPVLGQLFRTDIERSERTELVILITPRVIRNRREGEQATERFLSKVRAVRRELESRREPERRGPESRPANP